MLPLPVVQDNGPKVPQTVPAADVVQQGANTPIPKISTERFDISASGTTPEDAMAGKSGEPGPAEMEIVGECAGDKRKREHF